MNSIFFCIFPFLRCHTFYTVCGINMIFPIYQRYMANEFWQRGEGRVCEEIVYISIHCECVKLHFSKVSYSLKVKLKTYCCIFDTKIANKIKYQDTDIVGPWYACFSGSYLNYDKWCKKTKHISNIKTLKCVSWSFTSLW